jgi:pSer/pThr/pTyr-binding forkhead associated (FHA) protein
MKKTPNIIVQLVHMQGPFKGEIQEYSGPEVIIGRHSTCHLIFPKELSVISRKHATITREGNRFKIVDHSSNGTFVNGKETKEIFLKDGDVLDFSESGPKVSFLTEIRDTVDEIVDNTTPSQVTEPPAPSPPPPDIQPQSQPEPQPRLQQPVAQPQPQQPVAQPQVQPVQQDTGPVSIERVTVPLMIQYGPTINSFKELPLTMGKSPDCEVHLDHPSVLNQHAQIFFSNGQYWVKDLTGRNQVTINGIPIQNQSALSPDNRLSLSPSGPIFRFIAGGRLVEFEEPVVEETVPKPKEQDPAPYPQKNNHPSQSMEHVDKVVRGAKLAVDSTKSVLKNTGSAVKKLFNR